MKPNRISRNSSHLLLLCAALASLASGCGDDDDDDRGSLAQRRGIGAACSDSAECSEPGQFCLPFKGGYCGLEGCQNNATCPSGSACALHSDGKSYCFLVCREKPECNLTRPPEVESNCSSNANFVEADAGKKASVPPAS